MSRRSRRNLGLPGQRQSSMDDSSPPTTAGHSPPPSSSSASRRAKMREALPPADLYEVSLQPLGKQNAIMLPHGESVIGRGPTTHIKDVRVSREHLRFNVNCRSGTVLVTQIGRSAGDIEGKRLESGVPVSLHKGQHLQLLHGDGDQHTSFVLNVEAVPPPRQAPAAAAAAPATSPVTDGSAPNSPRSPAGAAAAAPRSPPAAAGHMAHLFARTPSPTFGRSPQRRRRDLDHPEQQQQDPPRPVSPVPPAARPSSEVMVTPKHRAASDTSSRSAAVAQVQKSHDAGAAAGAGRAASKLAEEAPISKRSKVTISSSPPQELPARLPGGYDPHTSSPDQSLSSPPGYHLLHRTPGQGERSPATTGTTLSRTNPAMPAPPVDPESRRYHHAADEEDSWDVGPSAVKVGARNFGSEPNGRSAASPPPKMAKTEQVAEAGRQHTASNRQPSDSNNAFSRLMAASARQAVQDAASQDSEDRASPELVAGSRSAYGGRGMWAQALMNIVRHPEKHANDVVEYDDELVVIRDKYPKAKHHYLILPRADIPDYTHLKQEHATLIRHMQEKAYELNKRLVKSDPTLRFRSGFHAVPSMQQLHLHLISQDFDSPALKTKKHWNSFTTEFFVRPKVFYEALKSTGVITLDKAHYERLLEKPLHCHRCSEQFKNMPALKRHLSVHKDG